MNSAVPPYAQDPRRTLLEIGEYAAARNPGYTEAEVPRLIQEVRSKKTPRRLKRARR